MLQEFYLPNRLKPSFNMLLEFIHKEVAGLKEKQAQVVQQIQQAQKEMQRLTDTQLVISGALQALNHVLQEHQRSQQSISRVPTVAEDQPTSVSLGEAVSPEEPRVLDPFAGASGY